MGTAQSMSKKLALIALGPLLALIALVALITVSDGSSSPSLRTAAILLVVGIVLAVLATYAIARSLTKATKILSDDAQDLANRELPRLREALLTGQAMGGSSPSEELSELAEGEFADVASGLLAIRRSTSDFSGHVGDLRAGISDTFVNLARRNQSLIDRQLEAIDILEAKERDSDRLALLYRVDHLSTRMRRNAESLLVLAGATTPQRQSPAVELREVLRVAIGEVEDYRRIIPISLDPLDVAGHLAQDLAHLIAELMENAAQHSAPGTAVDVVGAQESDGSYTVRVVDRGTGIDAARRGELNSLLSSPPAGTLTIANSIGMHVVSRLAQRLGVGVFLAGGDDGGTAASVTVPAQVVAEWAREGKENGVAFVGLDDSVSVSPEQPTESTSATTDDALAVTPPTVTDPLAVQDFGQTTPDAPAPDIVSATPQFSELPTPEVAIAETPAPIVKPAPPVDVPEPAITIPAVAPIPDALQPRPMGRTAPANITPPVNIAPPVEPVPTRPVPETPAAMQPASHSFEEPATVIAPAAPSPSIEQPLPESHGPETEASNPGGLTKRQRNAPVSAESDAEARTAPSRRTPEQVRSMLSRYKTGLERGRTIEEDGIS